MSCLFLIATHLSALIFHTLVTSKRIGKLFVRVFVIEDSLAHH